MARTIYSYTDPVMDFVFPLEGHGDKSLFVKVARLAYMPLLLVTLWAWSGLVGYAEDQTAMAHALLPFGLAADTLSWLLPVVAVALGWMLWRTSAGSMGGFKGALMSINLMGTMGILFLCLINMLRIALIATHDISLAGALAAVWLILAAAVEITFRTT